jgi:predicted O-methyltransferase YrrM
VSYPAYLEALLHIKDVQLTNITLYPCSILTNDVTKFVPRKADFFFVDGQKNQYGQYLQHLEPIQAQESQIIIDDVIKFRDKLD